MNHNKTAPDIVIRPVYAMVELQCNADTAVL